MSEESSTNTSDPFMRMTIPYRSIRLFGRPSNKISSTLKFYEPESLKMLVILSHILDKILLPALWVYP